MRKRVAAGLLVLHVALLLYLTLVFNTDRVLPRSGALNLVPLRNIRHFLVAPRGDGVVNFWGNIAAFAPLGFLLPAVRSARTSAYGVALTGFALSAAIEFAQYLSGRRVADVDDLVLNTLGAVLGYFVWVVGQRVVRRAPRPWGRQATISSIGRP